MATVTGDNILSPLGFSSEENLHAVRLGKTALCHFDSAVGIPFPFTASVFSDDQIKKIAVDGFTRFESLALRSIEKALEGKTDIITPRTVLILSSTKGNVALLDKDTYPPGITCLAKSASRIAEKIGLRQPPIVVSNACISGVSAIILAERLLDLNMVDSVIVCGVDELSPFIMSGFESLKALSESECRPFDIERIGLNLGEAAATMILTKDNPGESRWRICKGAVRNDAYHISSPSHKAEGAFRSLQQLLTDTPTDDIAVLNVHGTATMYNDQMESKAIERAGLSDVPVNALKGYFGHTMGAAGILETILSIHSIGDGVILGSRNFEELGVSGRVNITPSERHTHKLQLIKMISGFGGGNAAILASFDSKDEPVDAPHGFSVSHRVVLTPCSLEIDGETVAISSCGEQLLTSLYKEKIGDYPRFYKMDSLSKLGFLATELLLQTENSGKYDATPSRGIAFFNSEASVKTDLAYLETMKDEKNFFPSPSLFVYTLPNIVTGEIALRHHYHGETAFYLLPDKDWDRINEIVTCMFCDPQTESVIAGWVEYADSDHFEADIFIANKTI